ncbi:WYL domain-containing protein [Paenibacillus flagellatus]|uniref:WYL domain-containing protein n=1 Tax=Paenibacillus flagellatus TaxID=2211139 RepID=A0A2V5KJ04_9BACL|nr:WYL domain-containing protein [Paenibacillus flagellatus]PYI50307.1 WYL domain-containing protein [Paenibacillus flagellatus]
MNPFEKIFNYQIVSRLEQSGAIPITSHERAWLKAMLARPAAAEAFEPVTLAKLRALLEDETAPDLSGGYIEKARSRERHVYHPLLRPLRRIVLARSGVRLDYAVKDGTLYENQPGFPYKLEYSMVKREWYLFWYHRRNRTHMNTKLANVSAVREEPLAEGVAERIAAELAALLESRQETATVEVVRLYNRELSRILYAFSCFEKDVEYDADSDTYRITLSFPRDEGEYMLSKIRFLGKRVRIVDGHKLQRRMYETATKALGRYGIE